MVDYFNKGIDIVFGVRKERKTDTFFKKHTAQAFYRLIRGLGGDIVYNHADFRLMSKRTLQALVSFPERNLFLREWFPHWDILLPLFIITVVPALRVSQNILSVKMLSFCT